MLKQLLTTSDVAELLGVPEATLHQWSYRHIGPPFARVGRYRRYDPSDVEAWIAAQKRGGTPDAAS